MKWQFELCSFFTILGFMFWQIGIKYTKKKYTQKTWKHTGKDVIVDTCQLFQNQREYTQIQKKKENKWRANTSNYFCEYKHFLFHVKRGDTPTCEDGCCNKRRFVTQKMCVFMYLDIDSYSLVKMYILVSAVSGENLNGKCQSWLHLTDRQKKINHDYIQGKKETNNASKVMIILVINCIFGNRKNVKKFYC